jgi:hypothetical protein
VQVVEATQSDHRLRVAWPVTSDFPDGRIDRKPSYNLHPTRICEQLDWLKCESGEASMRIYRPHLHFEEAPREDSLQQVEVELSRLYLEWLRRRF